MGANTHPTTVPKQLQNDDDSEKNSIDGKCGGDSYTLLNNGDDSLVEVRKNGRFEGYVFMGDIVENLE